MTDGISAPETIERALRMSRWAVVGCSPDPERPSNDVARCPRIELPRLEAGHR